MSWMDWVLLALVALCGVLALRSARRARKNGGCAAAPAAAGAAGAPAAKAVMGSTPNTIHRESSSAVSFLFACIWFLLLVKQDCLSFGMYQRTEGISLFEKDTGCAGAGCGFCTKPARRRFCRFCFISQPYFPAAAFFRL